MTKTFFFGSTGEQIVSNEDNGQGNADVQISLFNNGTLTSAFGFLDGARLVASVGIAGIGLGPGDSNNDVIILNEVVNNTGIGPAWRAAILWDERTQTDWGTPGGQNDVYEDLYGGGRYGLPAGNQLEAYETIIGSNGDDVVKLDYNASGGGVAYTFDITLDLRDGRDLGIGGEGNDAIFGGSEASNLGDGLWGMGGNDTLYGGRNQNGTTGADDLYGFGGNDTIYGNNDGDVYYGDSGNDTIFAAGSGLVGDSDTGNNVTIWGGLGSDTIFASIEEVNGAQRYYGGNPSPYWVDSAFDETATNTDDSANDTVSYFGATNGVVLDLNTGTITDPWPGALSGKPNLGTFTLTQGSGSGGAAAGDFFYGIEHVIGSNTGNDSIVGNDAANSLVGGGGNDTLSGDPGNDTLFGGGGNDSMSGNNDTDTIFGGTGADTISGGGGGDFLRGGTAGEGNWLFYGNSEAVSVDIGANVATGLTVNSQANGDNIAEFDNIIGGAQGDALTGSSLANTIYGGAGGDTIHGGGGADSLAGGGDAGDFISYASSGGGVSLNLATNAVSAIGAANDATGDVISGFLNAIGSGSADSITGTAGVNTIFGGAGGDTIDGGDGVDSLHGGLGDNSGDWLSYASSAVAVTLNLGANTSSLDAISNFSNALGTGQADFITGSAGVNSIFAGDGNDTVDGGDGGDRLDGGNGTDMLTYANSGAGVTVVLNTGPLGGSGHAAGDVLSAFENLTGSGLADSLTGDSGVNTIYGGAGVDTVDGLGGNDFLFGGVDGDFVNYGNSASTVVVNLTNSTATGGMGSDVVSGFQHVLGSNFNDTITGDANNNSLVGFDGVDSLLGGAGVDSLFGGNGNDILVAGNNGNANNVVVSGWDGETGSSAITVTVGGTSAQSSDFVFGGANTDTLDIQQGGARNVYNTPNSNISSFLAGVEIIIAGAAADTINLTFNNGVTRTAYAENVTVEGGSGNDLIFSGSANDLIVGGLRTGAGDGNNVDTLYGGGGNDTIFGDDVASASSAGADLLYGSAGDDSVFAGGGADTAYGGSGAGDSLLGEAGNDSLFDLDGGHLFGGDGGDLLALAVTGGGNYTLSGGTDGGGDLADRAYTSGNYASVTGDLGAGNDLFIASSTDSGSGQVDRVAGQSGNDVLSSWFGNDVLYGDTTDTTSASGGSDALWGGAGSDTIYGGAGTDFLYGGAGNGDVIVGGAGVDYYYYSRTDGNDLILDGDPTPIVEGDTRVNAIIVFPDFDKTELTAGSDQLRNGSGVFETDHDLYDNDGNDMVQLVDVGGPGGDMEIHILSGLGAGNVLSFQQQDISVIALWNNDATAGTPVVTQYVWDPVDQRYEYFG